MGRERLDGDLLREPNDALSISGALLALVALATFAVAVDQLPDPFRLDAWWRDLVQPPATWVTDVAEAFYRLGLGWFMIPLRIIVGAWLARGRRWFDLAAWIGGWAIADIATDVLKVGVGRARPDISDTLSFPSGHTKTAAQISVGLVLLTIPPWSRRWPAWAAAAAFTGAMALSRTVLDQHWLSDVIVGALLGSGAMILSAAVSQRSRDRCVDRRRAP